MQGLGFHLSSALAGPISREYSAFDLLKNSKASSAILRLIWPAVASLLMHSATSAIYAASAFTTFAFAFAFTFAHRIITALRFISEIFLFICIRLR
jgi:hypothetical protein